MAKIQSLASVMNDQSVIGISLDSGAIGIHIGGKQAGIFFYTATPESAVTAHIGSVCMNTGGSAGTQMYVKESGAGTNTGWVAHAA